MNPVEQRQYIDSLKTDISMLEAWKFHVEQQQVDFPLDETSKSIVRKDLVVPTGNFDYGIFLGSVTLVTEISFRDKRYLIFFADVN